jgi:thymidylate synthase
MLILKENNFYNIYLKILETLESTGQIVGKFKSYPGVFFELTNPCNSLISIRKNWSWCFVEGVNRLSQKESRNNPGTAYQFRPNWAKKLKNEEEDFEGFCYSYGDVYNSQLPVIIKRLKKGYSECILNIWDDKYLMTRDLYPRRPCTLTIQFMNRNGELDVYVNMRVNDVMNLLPYDVFHHTLLQRYVASETNLKLGSYFHFVPEIYYQKKRDVTGSVKNTITKLIKQDWIFFEDDGSFTKKDVELIDDLIDLCEVPNYEVSELGINDKEFSSNFAKSYYFAILHAYLKKDKLLDDWSINSKNLLDFNVIKL